MSNNLEYVYNNWGTVDLFTMHLLPFKHDIWSMPLPSDLSCIIQDLDGLFINYLSDMCLADITQKTPKLKSK